MTQYDNSGLIVAALEMTAPELLGGESDAEAYREDLKESGARVALFRQYDEGEHRAVITDKMREMLRLDRDDSGLNNFTDNYCSIVVDKMAGRLFVSNVRTADDPTNDDWLNPLLNKNDFEALQGYAFRGAVRDSESYIMVDPRTLEWTAEAMYDGYEGIVAIFSGNTKTPIWACKLWAEDVGMRENSAGNSTIRIVVYQPDVISFWFGEEGGNEVYPYTDFGGEVPSTRTGDLGDAAPDISIMDVQISDTGNGSSEVTVAGNTFPWAVSKVPLVRFANKLDNYDSAGKSELLSAIPLQDVLNRTLHSMVMASEFSAFKIKWSKGIEIRSADIVPGGVINLLVLDDHNNPVITEEVAKFLQAADVGEFGETDISQYINQIDRLAREVSQVTQTPIYGVTTEGVLSGEALKQLEIGLIGKVVRFQRQNTDSLKELIAVTAEMQNIFQTDAEGDAPAPEIITTVEVTWQPAELLDVTAQIAALVALRKDAPGLFTDNFYRNRIGSLLGLSAKKIEEESAEAEQENSDVLTLLTGGAGNVPVI